MSRKPLPLHFDSDLELRLRSDSRANDTIALHDAAIKSATSLMAVMNACLKSPQLNAHLLAAQQQSAGLKPVSGRPRSHTAPSTSLVEAPCKEPAELEGSTPLWSQPASQPSLHVDGSQHAAALGNSILRPHSSPQQVSYRMPVHPQHDDGRTTRNTGLPEGSARVSELHRSNTRIEGRTSAAVNLSGETLVPQNYDHGSEAPDKSIVSTRPDWFGSSRDRLPSVDANPQSEASQPSVYAPQRRDAISEAHSRPMQP
ncbi:hypothetical protein DOTSEDRAFT_38352 [Dothistroma septosporum NZE10]|uniref:Uncharacterized protein n=1 Tax=Dothistroma septosporum (strain NZE10 / CBS 128990) TaxID=675120 RepID=N1PFN4_DOTSN|nr:hypothetical protein DOTSEDRAFT_38352 [Dothistroma septosporum NZE10]